MVDITANNKFNLEYIWNSYDIELTDNHILNACVTLKFKTELFRKWIAIPIT